MTIEKHLKNIIEIDRKMGFVQCVRMGIPILNDEPVFKNDKVKRDYIALVRMNHENRINQKTKCE